MRKLRIFEHISLDGVIQAPGGRDEDGDYPYGGWAIPFRDPVAGQTMVAAHGKSFDLLLGRRTYDIWADFWPTVKNLPLADSLNAATKYVVTHRPENLQWGPAEGLRPDPGPDIAPDLVESIRRIKAMDGFDLIVWGSSTLTSMLLEHGLADEVYCLSIPSFWAKESVSFQKKIPHADSRSSARKLRPPGSLSIPTRPPDLCGQSPST